MKRKLIATSLLFAGILGTTFAPRVLAEAKKASPSELQAKAKVSEAQAQTIALAKVANGKIKEGELEEENGHLVWSFDIATPGTKNITEVQVDAITGAIVSITTETPKDEVREGRAEKKEKADKDEDDEKDEGKAK